MSINTMEELIMKLVESGAKKMDQLEDKESVLKETGVLYLSKPKLDIK